MSYAHSMSADIDFKKGVSVEQIREALLPLIGYWLPKDEISETRLDELDFLTVESNFRGNYSVLIHTEGEVGYAYEDIIRECANNLTDLCKATYFRLYDHSYGDMETGITYIWAGHPDDIKIEKAWKGWDTASRIMAEHGYDDEFLDEIYEKARIYINEEMMRIARDKENQSTARPSQQMLF